MASRYFADGDNVDDTTNEYYSKIIIRFETNLCKRTLVEPDMRNGSIRAAAVFLHVSGVGYTNPTLLRGSVADLQCLAGPSLGTGWIKSLCQP